MAAGPGALFSAPEPDPQPESRSDRMFQRFGAHRGVCADCLNWVAPRTEARQGRYRMADDYVMILHRRVCMRERFGAEPAQEAEPSTASEPESEAGSETEPDSEGISVVSDPLTPRTGSPQVSTPSFPPLSFYTSSSSSSSMGIGSVEPASFTPAAPWESSCRETSSSSRSVGIEVLQQLYGNWFRRST